MRADILCFQEVHGQETPNQPRSLKTLKTLLQNTPYETYHIAHTKTSKDEAYDVRNLVIVSKYPIKQMQQFRNDLMPNLLYKHVTSIHTDEVVKPVRWERPIFYVVLDVNGLDLHVINLHLKSKIPTRIEGQYEKYQYKSVNGWAEGFFISSMKRVGQALETRMLLDTILDNDANAHIAVVGDFNAAPGEVPVETIVGSVENTANPKLGFRQLFACSNTIPQDKRYTHIHQGDGNLIDHMVVSRAMVAKYLHAEIHNEILHDESIAFATDKKYPESDHAPFLAEFKL